MSDKEISLTQKQAFEWLSNGHSIITPKLAKKICEVIGIIFDKETLVRKFKSDPPGTFKGLTLLPGHENQFGVDCLCLSEYIAKKLGISEGINRYFGRGKQARAYAGAIKKKLNIKEDENEH